jgi:hypothetical protein
MTVPVEIAVPDRESAGVLLAEAGPRFRAELVEIPGSAPVVRLEPSSPSVGWVFELLALVERWLDACRLPLVTVHHGNRSYVIAAAGSDHDLDGAAEPVAVG